MTVKALTHPRLLERLGNFFPQSCTIRQYDESSRAASGKPTKTPVNLADHAGIACRLAPGGGSEVRQDAQTFVRKMPRILLKGHYPLVTEAMEVLMDDGSIWDIQHVDHDGQEMVTRLSVERVD